MSFSGTKTRNAADLTSSEIQQSTQLQGVPVGRRLGWVDLDFKCSTVCWILLGLMGITFAAPGLVRALVVDGARDLAEVGVALVGREPLYPRRSLLPHRRRRRRQ